MQGYGEAWSRTISNLFQSSLYQHLPQTWHDGKGLFVQSCCPKQIDGPALAYLRKRRNRLRGTQYSLIGNLILVTPYPQPGSKSARTSFFVLGSTDATPYTETFSDTIVWRKASVKLASSTACQSREAATWAFRFLRHRMPKNKRRNPVLGKHNTLNPILHLLPFRTTDLNRIPYNSQPALKQCSDRGT